MIRAILTDIEGTTSSISFVKDVLFPFARERLPAFIETHADKPQVQHWLHEAAKEAGIIYAEREEIAPKLVFDRSEVANPPRNGLVIISATEGYRIGQTEPPDGITITAEVSRLSASDLAGKTLPEDL